MGQISTNEFKSGVKILIDQHPCSIIENEFVKPGKGQAFNRVKLRNLITGRVLEKTFKSGESFEIADVAELEMQYMYQDDQFWYFMDPISYEQLPIDPKVLVQTKLWIQEQDLCTVTLFNGLPIIIVPPTFVTLEIAETDPGLRGDTSSGGTKPATLVTGAVVRVPLFVQQGEKIKVDTREGTYVSREQ